MNGVEQVRQDVSRETFARLQVFTKCVTKWNQTINLVSKTTIDNIWSRHIEDSLQVAGMISEKDRNWLDLGSGGGLPGMVVAIVAADAYPNLRVSLIESDARKCAFLREAARTTEVDVNVINDRIENVPPQSADVISARALAALDQLLAYAQRHLSPTGRCIFSKGENFEVELAEARQKWDFGSSIQASVTNPNSVIMTIKELERG